MSALTIAQVLAAAVDALDAISNSPRLDAELLLSHSLGQTRSHLHAWPEHPVDDDTAEAFQTLITRRAQGEPMAYLLGEREFWSLRLTISPDTLIPRPETELLVALALEHLPPDSEAVVADLGTGAGPIALALAKERPHLRLVATDTSTPALVIAQINAARHGIRHIDFRHGSWFDPLRGVRLDGVVCNPPYVRAGDPHLERNGLPFEPRQALVPGPGGLEALTQIAEGAREHLRPGGWLVLEHGHHQAAAVAGLLAELGYREIEMFQDTSGWPRAAVARWKDGLWSQ